MVKVKVRVKQGSKGKPLGERVAQMRAEQGGEQRCQKLAVPRARLTTHINYGK